MNRFKEVVKKHKRILAALLSVAVFAATVPLVMMNGSAETITVEMDGVPVEFDVEPQIINGRTMVPLRKIFEEVGALVKWDGETQSIKAKKSSKTVELAVDSAEMTIDKGKTDENGNAVVETVTLDTPTQMVSDRTLVPLRAVSEAFGLDVEWNEKEKKVSITSKSDEDDSWKENEVSINLSDLSVDIDGVEVNNNRIVITKGGDYTVFGSIEEGGITVSSDEKVKIRLSGAEITSSDEPCIYVENAKKAYITLSDGTKNTLVYKNNEDGAIYSKDDLEIKGGGKLNITSSAHGIKASDDLSIEDGDISITAASDAIRTNDTFEMSGGSLSLVSTGDGIDSESIVIISGGNLDIKTNGEPISSDTESAESAEGKNNGFPMHEQNTDVEFESSSKGIKAEWMISLQGGEINVDAASHGIHCADEIEILSGDITVSSEYEKGISAHGNLTVSGNETIIDITKSTEGLESKKTLTVNNGTIKIFATDDGLNATGGNSGEMFGGGGGGAMPKRDFNENNGEETKEQGENRGFGRGFGRGGQNGEMPEPPERQNGDAGELPERPNGERGERFAKPEGEMPEPPNGQNGEMPEPPNGKNGEMPEPPEMPNGDMNGGGRHFDGGNAPGGGGRNMSDCLVINGGDIEIYAEDDCLDSNGNLKINGGTVKAVKTGGTFTGFNSVLDADGSVSIADGATVVAAAGGGMQGNLDISQNSITVYSENTHKSGESIILKNSNGSVILKYTPAGNYSAVFITSPEIITGKSYSVVMGSETFDIEVSQQNTSVGTQKNSGFGPR